MPTDQSLRPLWKVASKHLGLDTGAVEDDDIRKVLSGMTSTVEGIGAFYGHMQAPPMVAEGGRIACRQRHARLAIHASHTLVSFFLETWDERNSLAMQ